MADKIGSLHDLLISQFGITTRPSINPLGSAVTIAVSRVIPDNPRRVSVLLMNLGSNPIYIGRGNDVSATKGIYLAAGGGAITLNWRDDFDSVASERWAVSSGGNSTLYIEENVIL